MARNRDVTNGSARAMALAPESTGSATSTASGERASRVLLVVMPWADPLSGSLGVGTLKAVLAREGLACDVRYFNLQLARRLGLETCSLISQLGGGSHRGEIFFSPHFFGMPLAAFSQGEIDGYARGLFKFLRETGKVERYGSEDAFRDLCVRIVRDEIPAFLSACLEETPWDDYDIVGFSLMFDQTLPSLCLARAIKERHPHISIVFGGAACDGETGAELVRSFDCIDVVVRGEADRTLAPLVRALRSGAPLDVCRGIVFRHDGTVVETEPAELLVDMDTLPAPDYHDYVADGRNMEGFEPSLYFESSRGCWWGQKHLCSFCGLNSSNLTFRRKSPERVLEEILAQEREYGISSFTAADNIIDMTFFKSLLPAVAAINARRPEGERLRLFYETKSNLKKPQFELLRDAGVTALQPGIESFSDHVLELMKKGASGIQQVQFIKWATEFDLRIVYGVLHSNPGERPEDYIEMRDTVRRLRHLAPPMYVGAVTLDRFSPYFTDPEAYGIRNVRAHESYRKLFPTPHIDHERLAYKFQFDHDNQVDAALQAAIDACVHELTRWRTRFRPDRLVYRRVGDAVEVLDRRGPSAILATLRGPQAAIFEFCDEYHVFDAICAAFPHIDRTKLRGFLELLVTREWMYRDRRQRFISLPILRPSAFPASPESHARVDGACAGATPQS